MQNDSKNIETKTDMQNWWETDAQYTDIYNKLRFCKEQSWKINFVLITTFLIEESKFFSIHAISLYRASLLPFL